MTRDEIRAKGARPQKTAAQIPTESAEQQWIFRWATYAKAKHPCLALLYHIPNGGARHPATAARLKAEGVKAGVPDICLPVPRNGYAGLYIELKRRKGGHLEDEQAEWLAALSAQGYAVAVCKGADAAIEVIEKYIAGKHQEGCMP